MCTEQMLKDIHFAVSKAVEMTGDAYKKSSLFAVNSVHYKKANDKHHVKQEDLAA